MKIKLNNVRLSFPSLFQRSNFNGVEGKFEATFLMDKETHAKVIAEIENNIESLKLEHKVKVASDKCCLKDGDNIDYDGYKNTMAIKATSNKRVTIIDRDKTPLHEDDANAPYAGCYVNAVVSLWIQNNQYGKRVNCNLLGVQFVKEGQAFGSSNDCLDDFDMLDDDDAMFS